jgi:hypothetical protein
VAKGFAVLNLDAQFASAYHDLAMKMRIKGFRSGMERAKSNRDISIRIASKSFFMNKRFVSNREKQG